MPMILYIVILVVDNAEEDVGHEMALITSSK